ncbi:MAG TPA: SBBP repeat-containing protein [Candidatus Binatia bacterium]
MILEDLAVAARRNTATFLRNPVSRLCLKATLLAAWATLAFPALVLPPNKSTVHERTSHPDAARMVASASSITASRPPSLSSSPQSHSRIQPHISKLAKLPLYFEANDGQIDEQVKFVSRGRGYRLLLTASEAVIELQTAQMKSPKALLASTTAGNAKGNDENFTTQAPETVRMKFVGASAEPKIVGIDELCGKSNYFIGNDPSKWRKNVPQYGKVRYEEVYPGIDVVFYGNQNQLEFDFIVAPGADPDIIRLSFDGADKIETDQEGHLTLITSNGSVRLKKPFIYQESHGERQEISGRYVLNPASVTEDSASHSVAFELASYDPAKALVIDPGLEYSTFLGTSGLDDGNGIALDPAGNIYVVGSTGAGYRVIDVFVAKFSGDDFTLLYFTVFGGSTNGKTGVASDWGQGIAVDAGGNAYVTGRTDSSDFPTTSGAFQTSMNGDPDTFIAKLSSDGSTLLYSTRLGGSGWEAGYAVALDSDGNAYVTGQTYSTDFPVTAGAFDTVLQGLGSGVAFVAKLSADGSQVLYATFLEGGVGPDQTFTTGAAIAVDAGRNAHIAGSTIGSPAQLPTTPGAFDTSYNGKADAFVVKLNADGSQLLYSTFLGGGDNDYAGSIALDTAGSAYITGSTDSSNFPTTPGVFERTLGLHGSPFVVKLSADGSTLLYSTFFGQDAGTGGIAIDAAGNAYVVGWTCGDDFPTTDTAFNRNYGGCAIFDSVNGDAYVAKLSADGSRLLYSTFLGGSFGDQASGIALDPAGNVYVVGRTESLDFPTTQGSFEPGGGPWDAFVAKLSIVDTNVTPGTIALDANSYSVREDAGGVLVTVRRRNGKDGEVRVDYTTKDSPLRPATPGLDYTATSGTLVFADGETSKSFVVPIIDDGLFEGEERLYVALSNVQGGATLGRPNQAWLIINENDPPTPPPPPVLFTLTVEKGGSGSGTVTSDFIVGRNLSGSHIDCGSVCSISFQSGSTATLRATSTSGSTFSGWSGGGCSGTDFCRVRIFADTSVTATFTANPVIDAITVASANGGESWQRKKRQTIRWTYSGNPGNQVKIDLLKAGVLNQTISTAAPLGTGGSGSLTWTVPKKATLGSDYAIRICSVSSPSICDVSNGNFSIAK